MKPQLEMLEDRLVPSTASTSVLGHGVIAPPLHTLPPVLLVQTLPPTRIPPPHTLPPSPLPHGTLPPTKLPPPHTMPPTQIPPPHTLPPVPLV